MVICKQVNFKRQQNKVYNVYFKKKKLPVNDSLKLCFYKNPIKRVENIPFLGIILYEALSWKPHILALLQKVRRNIGLLFIFKY